jgi:hypothetical protein
MLAAAKSTAGAVHMEGPRGCLALSLPPSERPSMVETLAYLQPQAGSGG